MPNTPRSLPRGAKVFIGLVSAIGLAALAGGLLSWQSQDPYRFLVFLFLSALASGMKVSLPGITGTLSVNFMFILIAIVYMTRPESLALGCAAILIQYAWKSKERLQWVKLIFNVSSSAIAISLSHSLYHSSWFGAHHVNLPVMLAGLSTVYFAANTFSVATVVGLSESKSIVRLWRECYFWSFPYYLLGAAVVGLFNLATQYTGWDTSLLVLPALYLIYRSYRQYLDRLAREKDHAQEMASLHLRTIEALALAIEAKDQTTHDHLCRVQVYAIEVGKELNLSKDELDALRAAALLHDIGKLAVPEHIISKPGKLTPEEFEKMKIHPQVGAEILNRVQFPYPVVPIVACHHEKWDGSGYPNGVKGEEIPIGARILSAVDCLDALASDRQYRRALPLSEAMAVVQSESGKSFDPHIVKILSRRYIELENLARGQQHDDSARLNTDVRIDRGLAPAAGFENTGASRNLLDGEPIEFLNSIAAARHEVQILFEMAQDLGNSLSLDETLSVFAVRLRRVVPFDGMAIYLCQNEKMVPAFVTGDDFRLFSSLQIPVGQGLSGWVAENRKPIVNGNPSVEPGYLNDPEKFSTLRSAISVPLEGINGVVGVLTLYNAAKDSFTRDHLRILQAISSKLTMSVENSLKYRMVEDDATTDYLTGLPNARSLFLHLEHEVKRCMQSNSPLTILACDLNGFKQVNDRFGHLEGNRLLKEVADRLKEACRETDYVARMGGDEFVVVIPGLNSAGSARIVDRLGEAAREAGRHVFGEDLMSMSIGVAELPEDGCEAERLLAAADIDMYKTKRAGQPGLHLVKGKARTSAA